MNSGTAPPTAISSHSGAPDTASAIDSPAIVK